MIGLDLLLAATGGSAWRTAATTFPSVAIDGRSVAPGGLWLAIRGERHDGHDFAAQAANAGAGGLVVHRGRAADLHLSSAVTVVEVDDTTTALGALARAHRQRFPGLRVIGVTGSNGKTTTKELLAAILAAAAGREAVLKTEGNLNNHLGLPLTLLRLGDGHRFAVIEMGMSARGEIAHLADLAAPEIGVIVNVGPVHLETLGSIDEVARAKGELFAALPRHGVAVYPEGDERIAAQARASRAARHLRFGEQPGTAVRVLGARPTAGGTDVELRLPDGARVACRLAAVGAHHAGNAAAAAAVAHALGIDAPTIARGLASAIVAKHRSTLLDLAGRHVLDDCYNASPLSTIAAIDTLADLRGSSTGRAFLAIGDMLELGPDSAMLHRSMGEHAARRRVDRLLALGPHAQHVVAGARVCGLQRATEHFSVDELADALAEESRAGDWILVKASRGMQLERVIDLLRHRLAPPTPTPGEEG